jgi:hypothetical protein
MKYFHRKTMELNLNRRIKAFTLLGKEFKAVAACLEKDGEANFERTSTRAFFKAARDAAHHNPWFTRANVTRAIAALGAMLEQDKLKQWTGAYPALATVAPLPRKEVAVVMAGNIPLVGFHDFLCVLMAGHRFLGKLSSQDRKLPTALGGLLSEIEPLFSDRMSFSGDPIHGFDAVIATGSNNSARYFEHYFGQYPHIIRKNRNSVAVLDGSEQPEELRLLGEDVFSFFGLGCRNVSKLLVPEGYDLSRFEEDWSDYRAVADHHKYYNNYEYYKAIHLVNRAPFVDTGFCLLRQDPSLASPVSVIHYDKYDSVEGLDQYLKREAANIQCIVGKPTEKSPARVPFGKSQQPGLMDYADGVDTLAFLLGLS